MHAPWNEPFERFAALFEKAKVAQPKDPNAFSLATVDPDGNPSVRVVLMKGFDSRGFTFFTNHHSRKGQDLLGQQRAAMCFYWPALEQQVRVEGPIEVLGTEENDAYFASRPRLSQLGAWASHQSAPLQSRGELESRLAELTKQYEGKPVPRPGHWGGFRLLPGRIEFWLADPFRLHHREHYLRRADGWERTLLNP